MSSVKLILIFLFIISGCNFNNPAVNCAETCKQLNAEMKSYNNGTCTCKKRDNCES